MSFLIVTLSLLMLAISLLMILLVLIQRGRGGGLAGAFGGMGGQSAFGTRAGDTFTRITIVLAVIWVLLAGGLGMMMRRDAEAAKTGKDTGGFTGGQDADKQDAADLKPDDAASDLQKPGAGAAADDSKPSAAGGTLPAESTTSGTETKKDDAPAPSDGTEKSQDAKKNDSASGADAVNEPSADTQKPAADPPAADPPAAEAKP